MIFKNKLFIILFIFFLFFTIILNYSNVFAVDYNYNDTKYTVADYRDLIDSKYYCILLDVFNNIHLFVSYQENSSYVNLDDNSFLIKDYKSYKYNKEKNEWILDGEHIGSNSFYNVTNVENMFYTSYNIYRAIWVQFEGYTYTDEVVFQGAPVTVEQVTIPEIQQLGQIPQVIAQVLKILIPIGLIVLSIGLVIYLTRLVISRVQ